MEIFHSERGQLSEWNKLWLFSTILCHRHNTSGNLTWFSQQNLRLTNMEFEPIRIPVFRSMRMCIPQMPYFGPAAWAFLERFGVETWYVESVLKYHKPNTIIIMIYNNDLFIVYMYHIVLLVGFLTILPYKNRLEHPLAWYQPDTFHRFSSKKMCQEKQIQYRKLKSSWSPNCLCQFHWTDSVRKHAADCLWTEKNEESME